MKQISRPVPIDEEPLLNNRYSVNFPENTGIEQYHVQGISSFTFNFETGKWNDITISIIEVIGAKIAFAKLMDYFRSGQRGSIVAKLLDGPGVCIYEISIDDYELLQVTKPDLVYGRDEVSQTTLSLRPKTISLGYGDQKVAYSSKES